MNKTQELVKAMGIPAPQDMDEAVRSRDGWIAEAMHYCSGMEHYRKQRDGFLRAALTSLEVRRAVESIVGDGWWRLLELEEPPRIDAEPTTT